MKKTILTVFAVCALLFACNSQDSQIAATETYQLKLSLNVPRIYNNTQSLGYRKYQKQKIVGKMQLRFDKDGKLVDVKFIDLVNQTHKMSNGKNVVYKTELDIVYPKFNCIGSNKTQKFNVGSVCFGLAAEPSYNIGEMNEDNGLYVVLAGKGKITKNALKTMSGYVAGTIGCGCMAYGHISPTRKLGLYGATDAVDDVAAVHGSWSAKLLK